MELSEQVKETGEERAEQKAERIQESNASKQGTERCRAGLKTAITQLLFKGPTQSGSVGPLLRRCVCTVTVWSCSLHCRWFSVVTAIQCIHTLNTLC